jgi:hypothetical protein
MTVTVGTIAPSRQSSNSVLSVSIFTRRLTASEIPFLSHSSAVARVASFVSRLFTLMVRLLTVWDQEHRLPADICFLE